MTEPQYHWQALDRYGMPFEDIPEEEFEQRLEEMIQDLECLDQAEVGP